MRSRAIRSSGSARSRTPRICGRRSRARLVTRTAGGSGIASAQHPAPSTQHPFSCGSISTIPTHPTIRRLSFARRADRSTTARSPTPTRNSARVLDALRARGARWIAPRRRRRRSRRRARRARRALARHAALRCDAARALDHRPRPAVAAAKRDEAVSLVDVAPTILHAAHVDTPTGMTGRDLLAVTASTDASAAASGRAHGRPAADVYTETEYPAHCRMEPASSADRWPMEEHR